MNQVKDMMFKDVVIKTLREYMDFNCVVCKKLITHTDLAIEGKLQGFSVCDCEHATHTCWECQEQLLIEEDVKNGN